MVGLIVCAGLVEGGLVVNLFWSRRRRSKTVPEIPAVEQMRRLKLHRWHRSYQSAVVAAGVLVALGLMWAEIHGWRQAHAVQAIRDAGGSVTFHPASVPATCSTLLAMWFM